MRRGEELVNEINAFLKEVDLGTLKSKEIWKKLRAYVKIKPDGDLLPVRMKFQGKDKPTNIGLCPATA